MSMLLCCALLLKKRVLARMGGQGATLRRRILLPEDVAAAFVDGLGHQAHQAAAAATVDQVDLPFDLRAQVAAIKQASSEYIRKR
jgi:hypothetical protein